MPLENLSEFNRLVNENLPEVISLFDASFKRQYITPGVSALLGYTPDEILAMRTNDLVHPDDLVPIGEIVLGRLAKRENCLVEHRLRHKNGHYVWVEVFVKPILDAQNEITWILTSARNITNRRKKEMEHDFELKLREQLLSISMLSHEIRTSLQTITSATELLLTTPDKIQETQLIETLHFSGKTILNLINNVLDFSQIKEKKISIDVSFFDPRKLCIEISSQFKIACSEKNITLKLSIAENVPKEIGSDPIRLTQVITNLLSNAVKFTKRGFVIFSVSLERFNDTDILLIAISDTGIGIPSTRLATIFEPFTQGNSDLHQSQRGSGLGLFIVKNIVDIFGGTIQVNSEAHIGTTMEIKLPVQIPTTTSTGIRVNRKKIKVLYVDDLRSNQILVQAQLQKAGISCTIASDAESALNRLRKDRPNAILLDLHLQNQDGLEIAKLVRSHDNNIPIIGFTGDPASKLLLKIQTTDINDILIKPTGIDVIVDKLRMHVANYKNTEMLIDLSIYQDLFQTNPTRYSDTILLLKEDLRQFADRLTLAAKTADSQLLKKTCHQITPILTQIRFYKLIKVIDKIDGAAKKNDWRALARYTDHIKKLIEFAIQKEL